MVSYRTQDIMTLRELCEVVQRVFMINEIVFVMKIGNVK